MCKDQNRKEGLAGDSKICFVVGRQKIFRLGSNFPSFSFLSLSETGVGVWALCVMVPLVWVDTELEMPKK